MTAEPLRAALHDPILTVCIVSSLFCALNAIMSYFLYATTSRLYGSLDADLAELQFNRILEETKQNETNL